MLRWAVASLAVAVTAVTAAPVTAAGAPAQGPLIAPRVINGDQGDPTAYPFLVSLLQPSVLAKEGAFNAQFCAGTLTTSTTVVTAAHCMYSPRSGDPFTPSDVLIGVGGNLKADDLRIVPVSQLIVDPAYVRSRAENDVAVIVLAEPITDVQVIAPVSPEEAAGITSPGSVVRVIGWGNTSTTGKQFPSVFRVGRLIVFPDGTCGQGEGFTLEGVTFKGFWSDEANAAVMICAAGASGTTIIDACQGDSGGPLVGGEGAAARLVGVVSWGNDCATRYPGVYTRISAVYGFLAEHGAVPAQEPPPTQPPGLAVTPLPTALRVDFTPPAGTADVAAFAASVLDPATGQVWNCGAAPDRRGFGSCTVTGLADGTPYQVTAIAGTPSGNSPVAGPVTGVPSPAAVAGRIVKSRSLPGGRAQFSVTPSLGADLTVNAMVCTPVRAGATRTTAITGGRVTVKGLRPVRYSCAIHTENAAGSSTSTAVRIMGRR